MIFCVFYEFHFVFILSDFIYLARSILFAGVCHNCSFKGLDLESENVRVIEYGI